MKLTNENETPAFTFLMIPGGRGIFAIIHFYPDKTYANQIN